MGAKIHIYSEFSLSCLRDNDWIIGILILYIEPPVQEFRKHNFKKMYLWTDTSCNHDYYPNHGFTLATKYRDSHYSTNENDYITYIYWKPIE